MCLKNIYCACIEDFSASYLNCDFQRSLPSILSVDGELSGLVDKAAGLLESRPRSLDLQPQNQYKLSEFAAFLCQFRHFRRVFGFLSLGWKQEAI